MGIQAAIVVPESIDAIRALTGTIKNGSESIRITDDHGNEEGFFN